MKNSADAMFNDTILSILSVLTEDMLLWVRSMSHAEKCYQKWGGNEKSSKSLVTFVRMEAKKYSLLFRYV